MSATTPTAVPPAGLARRFAAFIYEGVLLFAVLFFACFLYVVLTRQKDALFGAPGYVFAFVVPAAYFLYFWTRTGQTLALKTWHLRVVDMHGRPLGMARAFARYVLSWLWLLPGLSLWLFGVRGGLLTAGLVAWIAIYTLLARLHPQRQFLHDVIAGSRVVTQLPLRR
ncbi:RDD family protein [Roseateles asaccharophilus]|uniref:RDD family membrane protein YckC n=1 Tax=Roseateles asaccharophilus TaxID=582607 RepID=A0ABU2A2M7_9BURK|nr:RDD family protein [Roseateles asaccharophilus]MDR7331426.1 putative RDD family membrane protein YckC [Roseateles asaccharophilus]